MYLHEEQQENPIDFWSVVDNTPLQDDEEDDYETDDIDESVFH